MNMEIGRDEEGEGKGKDEAIQPLQLSEPTNHTGDNGTCFSNSLVIAQGIIVYANLAVLSFLVLRVHNVVNDDDIIPTPQYEDIYYNESQKVLSKCHGILFTFAAFIFTIVVQEMYIRAEKGSKLRVAFDFILLVKTYALLVVITSYQLKHSTIYDHLGLFHAIIALYFGITLLITLLYAVRLCKKMRRLGRQNSESDTAIQL